MNGCDYLFTSGGQMSIKCPEGAKIEWGVWGCVATIGSQGPLTGFKYFAAAPKHTALGMEALPVKGIKLTMDPRLGCIEAVLGAFEGEIVRSNDILTAENEGELASFWVE
jgi:hypothetical protein